MAEHTKGKLEIEDNGFDNQIYGIAKQALKAAGTE